MIEQRPPAYSALKIAGERAYKLARSGESVDLARGRSKFMPSKSLVTIIRSWSCWSDAAAALTFARSAATWPWRWAPAP